MGKSEIKITPFKPPLKAHGGHLNTHGWKKPMKVCMDPPPPKKNSNGVRNPILQMDGEKMPFDFPILWSLHLGITVNKTLWFSYLCLLVSGLPGKMELF